jgi:hypothetical protein
MASKRLPVTPAGPPQKVTDYRATLSVIILTAIGEVILRGKAWIVDSGAAKLLAGHPSLEPFPANVYHAPFLRRNASLVKSLFAHAYTAWQRH